MYSKHRWGWHPCGVDGAAAQHFVCAIPDRRDACFFSSFLMVFGSWRRKTLKIARVPIAATQDISCSALGHPSNLHRSQPIEAHCVWYNTCSSGSSSIYHAHEDVQFHHDVVPVHLCGGTGIHHQCRYPTRVNASCSSVREEDSARLN